MGNSSCLKSSVSVPNSQAPPQPHPSCSGKEALLPGEKWQGVARPASGGLGGGVRLEAAFPRVRICVLCCTDHFLLLSSGPICHSCSKETAGLGYTLGWSWKHVAWCRVWIWPSDIMSPLTWEQGHKVASVLCSILLPGFGGSQWGTKTWSPGMTIA